MSIRPAQRAKLGARALLVAVAVASVFTGCQKSELDHIAAAQAAITANQPESALIHLKNAVEANPKNAQARLLLGIQSLAAGDAAAAIIDLRRARELKASDDDVLPVLAEALLESGETKALIEQLGDARLSQAKAQSRLTTTLALAHTALGSLPQARRLIAQALLADASSNRARLALARVTAAGGDTAGALVEIEKLLVQMPRMDDAWSYKAELLERQPGQLDAAAAAYTQALQINPVQAQAMTAMVGIHLAKNDLAKTAAALETLRKAVPKSFYAAYYQARLNARTGKNAIARTQYQNLLNAAPNNAVLLMASGINELALKAPVQAVTQLGRAVNLSHGNVSARYHLAQGQLQLGRPDQASAALAPLLENSEAPVEVIVLAAQARLLQGDANGADALFARAAKLNSVDPKIRTALAMARASRGDPDAAMRELQLISDTTSDVEVDLKLVSTHLVRNDLDAALKTIAVLERKVPDSPMAPELRGRVLLKQNNPDAARKAFEQSLLVDKNYFPAVARLTELDLEQKKNEAARTRLVDLQARQPDNARVMVALASVAARTGGSATDVLPLLERATKADPRDAFVWLALVEFHFKGASLPAALSSAQAAVLAVPDNVQLLDALARIQIRANDTSQAAATFGKLIQLAPKASVGYLGQAMTYAMAGNLDGATKSAKLWLAIDPQSIEAQQVLAGVALKRKKPKEALEIAKNLQRQYPAEAMGHALEGEIELDQGNFGPASAAFRKGLDKRAADALVPRLHTALLRGQKLAEAEALVASRLKSHPKDIAFLSYLGENAYLAKDYATAQTRFEQTLAINPNLPGVLNNLAMTLLQQKKAGAVEAAERATALTADNPAFLDTLAEAYVSESQYPKAVAALRKAINRTTDPSAVRLTLAKVYIKADDRKSAMAELERLVDLGDTSPLYREARQLLSVQRQR